MHVSRHKMIGSLEDVSLDKLLAACRRSLFTGTISLDSGGKTAQLELRAGIVNEAKFGDLAGDAAVAALRGLTEGNYDVEQQLPDLSGELRTAGLDGDVATVRLAKVMRHCEDNALSCSIIVKHGSDTGEIAYRAGAITTVSLNGAVDMDAIVAIVGWTEAEYRVQSVPLDPDIEGWPAVSRLETAPLQLDPESPVAKSPPVAATPPVAETPAATAKPEPIADRSAVVVKKEQPSQPTPPTTSRGKKGKKKAKAAAAATAKAEPVKAEPVKAEPVKAEPVKAEPVKAEPAKAEPVKAEPVKAEPVKAEPVKAEPVKAEPVKAEPAKAQPAKAQPAKELPTRAQPAKAQPAEKSRAAASSRRVNDRAPDRRGEEPERKVSTGDMIVIALVVLGVLVMLGLAAIELL